MVAVGQIPATRSYSHCWLYSEEGTIGLRLHLAWRLRVRRRTELCKPLSIPMRTTRSTRPLASKNHTAPTGICSHTTQQQPPTLTRGYLNFYIGICIESKHTNVSL